MATGDAAGEIRVFSVARPPRHPTGARPRHGVAVDRAQPLPQPDAAVSPFAEDRARGWAPPIRLAAAFQAAAPMGGSAPADGGPDRIAALLLCDGGGVFVAGAAGWLSLYDFDGTLLDWARLPAAVTSDAADSGSGDVGSKHALCLAGAGDVVAVGTPHGALLYRTDLPGLVPAPCGGGGVGAIASLATLAGGGVGGPWRRPRRAAFLAGTADGRLLVLQVRSRRPSAAASRDAGPGPSSRRPSPPGRISGGAFCRGFTWSRARHSRR